MGEFAAEAEQVNRSGDDTAPAMTKHCRKARRDALLLERLTLLEITRCKPGKRGQRTKGAIEAVLGKALSIRSRIFQKLRQTTSADGDESIKRAGIGKLLIRLA
jgi:hypothetical protein